ncbi:MAG TPA: creatininase family protein [Steroidobacteraceae bacterium]
MKSFFAYASLCCCLAFATAAGAQDAKAPGSGAAGRCQRNIYNCGDTPNPLPKVDTIWLEEMTWMDVRDALAAGIRTVIIPTGGIEPNGPWVALGKHDYVLRATCDAIARKLGNALCAPVIGFVDEGDLENKSGHMDSAGTISVRKEIYEGLVTDIARSMKAHGFEHIMLISDNGGSNEAGMKAVAQKLNAQWGAPIVHHIPEYYQSWEGADALLLKKGLTKPGVKDGIHDDPSVTLLLMLTDPNYVRWQARVKAGKATIDGVSILDKKKALQWGKELLDYRSTVTVEAINKAIAGDTAH